MKMKRSTFYICVVSCVRTNSTIKNILINLNQTKNTFLYRVEFVLSCSG